VIASLTFKKGRGQKMVGVKKRKWGLGALLGAVGGNCWVKKVSVMVRQRWRGRKLELGLGIG